MGILLVDNGNPDKIGGEAAMQVKIKPQLLQFIDDEVRAGRYESSDDVVNAALAAFQSQEELSQDEIEDLRAEVDEGIVQADRGDFVGLLGPGGGQHLRR